MISCPRCGSSADADTKFCTACGAGLAASAAAAHPSIGWNCPACGAHWDVNIRFCMKCGAARPGADEPAAALPIAQSGEPPRQGVNPWLVVAALALLLAGAGASGYLLYTRYRSGGAQTTAPPQPQVAQVTPVPAPQEAAPVPQETPPAPQETPAEPAPPPPPAPRQVIAPEPVRRSPRPSPMKPAPVTVQQAELPQPEVPAAEPKAPDPKPPEPVEMVKPEPQPPARTETAPPPAVPAKPAYSGPSSGAILWSGKLAKDVLITIDGRSASVGSLNGELPGVPVMVDVNPADVGVAEAPSPANGWKRLVLRGHVNRGTVVTIRWWVLR